jgi:hypothetical protein
LDGPTATKPGRATYHLFEDNQLLIEHLVGFLLTSKDQTYVLLVHHLHRIDLLVLVILTLVHLRKFTPKSLENKTYCPIFYNLTYWLILVFPFFLARVTELVVMDR